MHILTFSVPEEPMIWWNDYSIALITVILKRQEEEENLDVLKQLIIAGFFSQRTTCKLKIFTLANEPSLVNWQSWIVVYLFKTTFTVNVACVGEEKRASVVV